VAGSGVEADRQDAAKEATLRREGFTPVVGSIENHRFVAGLERRREAKP